MKETAVQNPAGEAAGQFPAGVKEMQRLPVRMIPLLGLLALCSLPACSTVTDLVTTSLPTRHDGPASIVIRLREQRAYLYKGGQQVAVSRVSTGREGYHTPVGRFRVQRKDADHRSSLYGDYVDSLGRVVKANVDSRKHRRPRGARFVGAPMPFYLQFQPAYGLHAGNLPGYPASHGCVRLPYWKARQFYNEAKIGTRVTIVR